MDKKDYVMVTLSLALIVSLGFNAMPDATHECDSREIKAYCFDLSSTAKTCYTLPGKIGGKRCTEGWNEINHITDMSKMVGKQYLCNSIKCVKIN